ncbi:MAG: DUF4179 domain-containing protein [Clostridia bacterium]|nr:DUF4179 domain-containing protein [Clostridia bacterium]
MILAAMEHDVTACTADKVLDAMKQEKSHAKRGFNWKKTMILAAAVFLMAVSVSAAAWFSAFGTVFDVPVDSGNVKILNLISTNEDVQWEITEVWFDEYNIHIGGTVTTPEVLDPDGEYMALCYFREPGDEEYGIMTAYVLPDGTDTTVPFIMNGGSGKNPLRDVDREGFAEDTVTLEMEMSLFHDKSEVPQDGMYYLEDYLVYQGEWKITAEFTSQDDTAVSVNSRVTGVDADGTAVTVESLHLTPFTLELIGENLTDSTIVWVKLNNGTYLGKENGLYANTENRIEYRRMDDGKYIFCFEKPIDPTRVESVILAENWEYRHHGDGSVQELWHTILEIPIE